MTKKCLYCLGYCFFFFIFINIHYSCSNQETRKCDENLNRVYFTLDLDIQGIVIPVYFNDSTVANMLFDTGAMLGSLELESSFVVSHPSIVSCGIPDSVYTITGWLPDYKIPGLYYKDFSEIVTIGGVPLLYQDLMTTNRQGYVGRYIDGMFNIPENDTIHVWELNFDSNYLEIHQVENFVIPENCFLVPMIKKEWKVKDYNYLYPLSIQLNNCKFSIDGDTLINSLPYLMDTGSRYDLILNVLSPEELVFFHKKEEDAWVRIAGGYGQRYTVNATLFDNFVVDSLCIYTHDKININIMGLNFLKRFNVFFDMRNRQIGFQPVQQFKSIINTDENQFRCLTETNTEGKDIILAVADYKNNPYKIAGLKKGDEIVSINGILFKNLNNQDIQEMINTSDTLIYDIIRRGQALKITVFLSRR